MVVWCMNYISTKILEKKIGKTKLYDDINQNKIRHIWGENMTGKGYREVP